MQVLGSLLQLAPCPFWRFEAAIAPGPRLPHQAAPAAGDAPEPEGGEGGLQEAIIRTRRQRASDPQVQKASPCRTAFWITFTLFPLKDLITHVPHAIHPASNESSELVAARFFDHVTCKLVERLYTPGQCSRCVCVVPG